MYSTESQRIRAQMARIRDELSEDVVEVVEQARELTDWHGFVKRHPWLCVGTAAAVGFLLVPSRSKSNSVAKLDVAEASVAPRVASGSQAASMRSSLLNPLVSIVAGTIVRSAMTVATDQLQRFLVASATHPTAPRHTDGAPRT